MLRLARFESFLWAGGLICLGYCIYLGSLQSASQREADKIVEHSSPVVHAAGVAVKPDATPTDEGGVIGRIEIPRLGLTAPITADYDPDSLRKGVGHIRGSAMPGGLGTVGLAGHRDSYFRPLRRAVPAMEIRLSDRTGTYLYAIDSTEIVTPEQVRVLDVADRPGLTLVTCFPFDYVGAAPKRFIVHAHLLSLAPETATVH